MELVFLGFLAVCSFLHQGLSLSCYECNSQENHTCLQHPPDSARKQCTYRKPICRVIYTEVKIAGSSPHERVARMCGEMEPRDQGKDCYRISDYGAHQKVCSCMEDYCNSSSIPAAEKVVFVVVASILTFLY